MTTGSKTLTLCHHPEASNGSEPQGLTQSLFWGDVFEAVETASAAGTSSTSSTTYQTKNSLTTASQASSHDYVYLVVMGMDNAVRDITLSTYGEVRLAGVQMSEEEVAIDRVTNDRQLAWVYAERNTGNRALDTRYRAEAGQTTVAEYAHIIALRYKEPAINLGLEETP